MPKFEEYNSEKIKPEEKKEPANIVEYVEYCERDLQKKEKMIEWLEIKKEALKDFKNLTEDDLNFLIKEFEIEIKVNKSMIELTKQRLAEKKTEADEK